MEENRPSSRDESSSASSAYPTALGTRYPSSVYPDCNEDEDEEKDGKMAATATSTGTGTGTGVSSSFSLSSTVVDEDLLAAIDAVVGESERSQSFCASGVSGSTSSAAAHTDKLDKSKSDDSTHAKAEPTAKTQAITKEDLEEMTDCARDLKRYIRNLKQGLGEVEAQPAGQMLSASEANGIIASFTTVCKENQDWVQASLQNAADDMVEELFKVHEELMDAIALAEEHQTTPAPSSTAAHASSQQPYSWPHEDSKASATHGNQHNHDLVDLIEDRKYPPRRKSALHLYASTADFSNLNLSPNTNTSPQYTHDHGHDQNHDRYSNHTINNDHDSHDTHALNSSPRRFSLLKNAYASSLSLPHHDSPILHSYEEDHDDDAKLPPQQTHNYDTKPPPIPPLLDMDYKQGAVADTINPAPVPSSSAASISASASASAVSETREEIQQDNHEESPKSTEVAALLEKKDVFNLICMLRSESRLEAAKAIVSLAKQDESKEVSYTNHHLSTSQRGLNEELVSSGGMHSLLTLFKSSNNHSELERVAALGVAYLTPAACTDLGVSTSSSGGSTHRSSQFELNLLDCFRFLVNSNVGEDRTLAALALTQRWIHVLQPMFQGYSSCYHAIGIGPDEGSLSSSNIPGLTGGGSGYNGTSTSTNAALISAAVAKEGPALKRHTSFNSFHDASTRRRQRFLLRGSRPLERRRELAEMQELMEKSVALVVAIANSEMDSCQASSLRRNATLAVGSMCAVDQVRPLVVREGLIKTLVQWLHSNDADLVHCAANSLRDLASPEEDEYMAGCIHSQILTERAIPVIVKLALSNQGDVRLAVAQLLSSLSVAPHTGAAVLEADGLSYLVQLLNDAVPELSQWRWDEHLALAAGTALLRLATGSNRCSRDWVYHRKEGHVKRLAKVEEYDDVITEIVQRGVLEPLVAMATAKEEVKVRHVAVELLCIISDDVRPDRWTRQKLCEANAAKAFGTVVKQGTFFSQHVLTSASSSTATPNASEEAGELTAVRLSQVSKTSSTRDAFQEMYHALHGLANMLEPTSMDEEEVINLAIKFGSLEGSTTVQDAHAWLDMICRQTAESGAVGSLLLLATLLFIDQGVRFTSLCYSAHELLLDESLVEVYRSLASLCPLFLSQSGEEIGLAVIASDILQALTVVLTKHVQRDSFAGIVQELHFDALRGLSTLASYAPLKSLLVNDFETLTQLLQLKNARKDIGLAQAAGEVLLALDFCPKDMELAGNDPRLLADWFFLERSLLLQAMARTEILYVLYATWSDAITQLDCETEVLGQDQEQDAEQKSDEREQALFGTKDMAKAYAKLQVLFPNLANDSCLAKERNKVMQQYQYFYGKEFRAKSKAHKKEFTAEALGSLHQLQGQSAIDVAGGEKNPEQHLNISGAQSNSSPIYSNQEEKGWILEHRKAVEAMDWQLPSDEPLKGIDLEKAVLLPDRVTQFLDRFFPSKLCQSDIIPLHELCPMASFNFRALAMPQRRYFSFRREGHVLARICDKGTATSDAHVKWSLTFTNSKFAGEFAETLVQTLYRCPSIYSVAFTRMQNEDSGTKGGDNADGDGSELLSSFAGSIPPSVTWLTFDNVLNKSSAASLINILEEKGHRAMVQSNHRSSSSHDIDSSAPDVLLSQPRRAQASLEALAIRTCNSIRGFDLNPFFDLLRIGGFLSLRVLDLSGNDLGDEKCSMLLSAVYTEDSKCALERLDLSGNCIGKGTAVADILLHYAHARRNRLDCSRSRTIGSRMGWSARLKVLKLHDNSLSIGSASESILSCLEDDALNLSSLSLACNGLCGSDGSLDGATVAGLLVHNKSLVELDLSQNSFSLHFVENMLRGIEGGGDEARTAFVLFDGNNPPLSIEHIKRLRKVMNNARRERVKHHIERKQGKESSGELPDDYILDNEERELKPAVGSQAILTQSDSCINEAAEVGAKDLKDSIATRRRGGPGETGERGSKRRGSLGGNKITVLFSSPLVFRDANDEFKPIEMLDVELERELLWSCFKEASMDIELSFDTATTHRLQSVMTKCCGCLHYSGHGHPKYLTFEDGKGGLHWVGVDLLKDLISNGVKGGGAPFKFVFVSACHSRLAGETFTSAGVPHVVCCQQESQIMDSAALAFTRAFYLAVAVSRTVKDAFEIGRQAVAAAPTVPNSDEEMRKFVLLPEDGDHDVPIFEADHLAEWPKNAVKNSFGLFAGSGGTAYAEQPLPSIPDAFMGREVEMYLILNELLATTRRFVSIVGVSGIGRSSLASSICHFINDRKSTMISVEIIFYVRPQRAARGRDHFRTFIAPLFKQVVEAGLASNLEKGCDFDALCQNIFSSLSKVKALVVIDGSEILEGSEEERELPLFLSSLFRETKDVKVLRTGRRELGLASLGGVGEYVYKLGPLNFNNTVRLFGIHCPYVRTGQERARLVRKLVPEHEACLVADDRTLCERSRSVLSRLGEGIPARTFDAAYRISLEEYQDLLRLGWDEEQESATPTLERTQSLGSTNEDGVT